MTDGMVKSRSRSLEEKDSLLHWRNGLNLNSLQIKLFLIGHRTQIGMLIGPGSITGLVYLKQEHMLVLVNKQ